MSSTGTATGHASHPSRATRRGRGLWFKLFTVLVSVIVMLLLLEAVVRIFNLQPASYSSISGFCRYDADLGWNLISDHRVVFKGRHFSALVETSSQGLRDRVFPLERVEGRRRILVVGDSVVWCWGVAIEECFTKRLENLSPETEVITMGVPGYSTAQAMRLYELQGSRFNPHVVVHVSIGNDLAENLDQRKRPHFAIRDGGLVQTNDPVERRKGALKEWLIGNSELFVQFNFGTQVAQATLEALRQRFGRDGFEWPDDPAIRYASAALDDEDAWQLYEALLDGLRERVLADGAEFVLVSLDQHPRVAEWLAGYCKERGCRMIDAGRELDAAEAAGHPVRLRGDPHPSSAGQKIVADALRPVLER